MSRLNLPLISTVGEFFQRQNWSGFPPQKVVTIQESAKVSLKWTVAEFFERQNWKGEPITAVTVQPTQLTLTRGVKEFFYYFPWEGKPLIAAQPILSAPETGNSEGELNLQDLSDLF